MSHDHTRLRRQNVQVIVALSLVALVPAIYGGLLTWANSDTSGRIDQIPAMIVNADRPAALDDGTTLNLGDGLTDELVGSTESSNFSWTATDAQTAQSRLASGEVFAVLWVPEDFSSSVASLQGDANAAARAKLTIETDDAVNTIAGNIATSIGTAISDALAESISQEYLENIYVGFTATHDAVSEAADGATDLATAAGSLAGGTSQLEQGVSRAADGAADLAEATGRLSDGIDAALAGAATLREGLSELHDRTDQLASQAANVHSSLQGLNGDWDNLTDAERRAIVDQLMTQAGTLSSGAADIHQKAGQVRSSAASLTGANTDLRSAVDGMTQLAAGAQTLSASLATLSAGAADVADGSSQLHVGATSLADGLAEGRDQIPTYTDAEAAHLAEVASAPVEHTAIRANEVPTSAYAMGPYFMALALWIGGIALYLLTEPLRGERLGTWLGGLFSFAPGAVMAIAQSLALVITIRYLLGVEAANLAALTALAVLASMTFIAINQALVALLGTPGRFLALILIVVQLAAAGGTYPVQTAPGFFAAVHDWLPLTHAVGGFRSLIAGGSIDMSGGVLVIAVWLIASLAITTLAAKRHRQLPQAADTVTATPG